MKKAMVRRLQQKYHVEWFEEDGAAYPVRVFLKRCGNGRYRYIGSITA